VLRVPRAQKQAGAQGTIGVAGQPTGDVSRNAGVTSPGKLWFCLHYRLRIHDSRES
jgi:hypothetical protein